jgi:hypothetical protein
LIANTQLNKWELPIVLDKEIEYHFFAHNRRNMTYVELDAVLILIMLQKPIPRAQRESTMMMMDKFELAKKKDLKYSR